MTLYINGREIIMATEIRLDEYLYHVGDADTYIRFTNDRIQLFAGGNEMVNILEAATDYIQFFAGKVFIGDTANANMAQGLTVNQGANDDEILTLKSSDIAHGVTDEAETDTYGHFGKAHATGGGLEIVGYTDTDASAYYATRIIGVLGEAANTGKGAGEPGIIDLAAYVKNGTALGAPGADANLVSIRSATNTRFIFDQEGEMHSDAVIGIGDDWDEYDDLVLAHDLSRLPKAKFNEMMKYNAEDFERAGLVTLGTDKDGTRHAFVKHKAMLQFAMCCFGEVYQKFNEQAAELTTLKRQMRLLTS